MTAAQIMTADELVRALKRRRAALPSEIGTFIIFEACEALLSKKPGRLTLQSISISEDGMINAEPAQVGGDEVAARSLHALLTSLLVAAGPAPTHALLRLVEEGPREGRWTLHQLRDDLEEALVPLNRTASRRVLSRLVRETTIWADKTSRGQKAPTFNELDEQLSSFLGVPHTPSSVEPAPEKSAPPAAEDETRRDLVHAIDSNSDEMQVVDDESTGRQARDSAREGRRGAPPQIDMGKLRDMHGLSERPSQMPRQSQGVWIGFGLIVLAVGLVTVTLVMRPDALARLRGDAQASQPAASAKKPDAPAAPRAGDLIISVMTERAQILRFVGLGPLTIEHLPTGVAHELVAIADHAATRVLIPKDAEWEQTKEGPRYEVAMQAGTSRAKEATLDLGETLLPADVGQPSGSLGSLRVVTTPRGARVYQVIGFAPEATIHDVALDRSEELLIYKRGFKPETRTVTPSDFADEGGRRTARVKVTLASDKRDR
jgi:hypothetical protein